MSSSIGTSSAVRGGPRCPAKHADAPRRDFCTIICRAGRGDPRWPWLAEREHLQREADKAVALASEVKSLEGKIEAFTRELDELRHALADRNVSANSVEGKIEALTRERDELRRELADRNVSINALERGIAALTSEQARAILD